MHTLLIVNGAELLGAELQPLAAGLGYHTLMAADGEEALRVWLQEPVDIVLTALRLPGTDSYELLREARQRGFTQPVIALADLSTVDDVLHALRLGVVDYLPLPFDQAALAAALERAEQALLIQGHFERLLHDLRHPLAAMIMSLQLLERDDLNLTPSEHKALVQDMRRHSHRLLSLLKDPRAGRV